MATEVYKYKLFNTENGSRKFGPCEICGKFCETTYYQIEYKQYKHGWTHENDLFGHKDCLITRRR